MFAASLVNEAVGTADSVTADKLRLLLTQAEYAGDPTNNLTPTFIGQFCKDTSGGHLYWASTAASSGWKKLNN